MNNWNNVEFKGMDMYEFPETGNVDMVIFCLSLTAIPNATKAMHKALTLLKSGGKLVIVDSIPLNSHWWHPVTNLYINLKSLIVGAKPTREVFTFIQKNMTDIQTQEMVGGVYVLITARKQDNRE